MWAPQAGNPPNKSTCFCSPVLDGVYHKVLWRACSCLHHTPLHLVHYLNIAPFTITCTLTIPNYSFHLRSTFNPVLQLIACVYDNILFWMNSNKLLLIPSKTEFLLLGTRPQWLCKFVCSVGCLTCSQHFLHSSGSSGMVCDSTMSFSNLFGHYADQPNFTYMEYLQMRPLLPHTALIPMANALVCSRLDYCNSLLIGITKEDSNKLQILQSHTKDTKYQPITTILHTFHWLPIEHRIPFTMRLIVPGTTL